MEEEFEEITEIYILTNGDGVITHYSTSEISADGHIPYTIAIEDIDLIGDETIEDIFNANVAFDLIGSTLVRNDAMALEYAKTTQMAIVSDELKQAIANGFEFALDNVTYHVPFGSESQVQLNNIYNLINNAIIVESIFGVRLNGVSTVITITSTIINDLLLASVNHVNDQTYNYQNILLPLINNQITIEGVRGINWDSLEGGV